MNSNTQDYTPQQKISYLNELIGNTCRGVGHAYYFFYSADISETASELVFRRKTRFENILSSIEYWEKEFEKEFWSMNEDRKENIKSFIRQLLRQEKERLLDRIKQEIKNGRNWKTKKLVAIMDKLLKDEK